MYSDDLKKTKMKCNKLIDVALQYKAENEQKDLQIQELREQLQKMQEEKTEDISETVELLDEVQKCENEGVSELLPETDILDILSEKCRKPTQEEFDRDNLELEPEVVIVYEKGFMRKIASFLGVIILLVIIAILVIISAKVICLEV